MKTATVRQLRTSFPSIERWLEAGETVSITKRRKVVAEIRAPRRPIKFDFKNRFGGPNPPVKPGRGLVDLLIEERGP